MLVPVLVLVLVFAVAACSDSFTPNDASPDATTPDASDAAGDAAIDHVGHDAGACETVGRTGGSDTCLLFAYCGHRHFALDCSARFTCVCSEPEVDGGPTKEIAAQPIFCESPATELTPAFEEARRACGW